MIRLTREVRFSLAPPGPTHARNSWAGWPMDGWLHPWLALRATVQAVPDAATGFVCNVTAVDRQIRQVIVDRLIAPGPSAAHANRSAVDLLKTAWAKLHESWDLEGRLVRLELSLSPYFKFRIDAESPDMIVHSQQFEFSAAHRLHCDQFSDEENRRRFGKCNNPSGHGHNYVVDVSVVPKARAGEGGPIDPTGCGFDLEAFQATVNRCIIERLDHKHLNCDIDRFQRVNPTVENIAIAIWDWLQPELRDVRLHSIRVYETPKTWAEYRGNPSDVDERERAAMSDW